MMHPTDTLDSIVQKYNVTDENKQVFNYINTNTSTTKQAPTTFCSSHLPLSLTTWKPPKQS